MLGASVFIVAVACGGSEFTSTSNGGNSPGAGGSAQTGGAPGLGGGGLGGGGVGGSGVGGGSGGTGGSPATCPGERKCVVLPPSAWTTLGYMSTDLATPCGAGLSLTKVYDGAAVPSPPPAQCACTCGSPETRCTTSLYCAPQTLPTCWDMTGKTYDINGSCVEITPPGTAPNSCGAQGMTGTASCPPVGKPTLTPVVFAPSALTCGEQLGSAPPCGAGHVCAAMPPTGAIGPCVMAPGDVPCPTAAYPKRSLLYARFNDTRGCDFACKCVDTHVTCSCTSSGCGVTLAPSCGGAVFSTMPVDGGCRAANAPNGLTTWSAMLYGYSAATSTQCAIDSESTATPIGGVVGSEPQTVCCMQ